jgi:hypothetical protein
MLISLAVAAASCGSEDGAGSSQAVPTTATPSTRQLVTVTTATPSTATRTSLGSRPDATDESTAVLAAAVLYRATAGNGWDDPEHFNSFYVVRRLGHADADGFISEIENGTPLTVSQRAAIRAALAPRTVTWIDQPEDARGDETTPRTIPDRHAIITIAAPVIDDDRAEVATELWCGWVCAVGSTFVLERSSDGVWKVTAEVGGYVS